MLGAMRMYVEVRDEDRPALEDGAWRSHRTPNEHASYLLSRAIKAEAAEHDHAAPPDETIAAVA